MMNKKLDKITEEELMDALAPNYSDYMYYKAKEWANVDGTGMTDQEQMVEFFWYDWHAWDIWDWEDIVEYSWEKYNIEHTGNYEIKEAA